MVITYATIPPAVASEFVAGLIAHFDTIPPHVASQAGLVVTGGFLKRLCRRCGDDQEIVAHYGRITPTHPWPTPTPLERIAHHGERDKRANDLLACFDGFSDFTLLTTRSLPFDFICKRCRRAEVILRDARADAERLGVYPPSATLADIRHRVGSGHRGCKTCGRSLIGDGPMGSAWKVFFDKQGRIQPGVYCRYCAAAYYRICGPGKAEERAGRLSKRYIVEVFS